MERSIFRTVFAYTALQLALIILFSTNGEVNYASLCIYGGASLILHAGLLFFLLTFKADFFNLSTGVQLQRINAANRITLLRISSLPTIAFLLRHKDIAEIKVALPIVLALIFLTDAFDGQIARRCKQITRIGEMLDSISDYSLLAVLSIVYYIHGIMPSWFFLLVFFRLFLQALGMFVFILMKKPIARKSTWGGKITIAIVMTLYVIELVRLYLPVEMATVFKAIEYVSGTVIFALSFEKGLIFLRQGKLVKQDKAAIPDSKDPGRQQ
jgi:CDP-diacylglycerol--glycerol-3-phosphate 3-phosphatidyltransferase